MERIAENVHLGRLDPPAGELGSLLTAFKADIVIGHPTFRNQDTIGRQIREDLLGALENFPDKKTAVILSDGSLNRQVRDERTLNTAIEAALETLSNLPAETRQKLLFFAGPYEGHNGNRIPGKGSALKMIFDEMVQSPAQTLMLLDGDLRNNMVEWQRVYKGIMAWHQTNQPGRDYFITARYARHVVDASLTRNIVGPLTTLMGTYVPGGISGDIVLSRGAVALERKTPWSDARYRYGTDISTTFDNIATGTAIYEVWLGAKLHDVTDDAKLSVMPGEVIGAALERLLYYERLDKRVSRRLASSEPLNPVLIFGPDNTGIRFINPGFTDVFNLRAKRSSLVDRFEAFATSLQTVLPADTYQYVCEAHGRLSAALHSGNADPLFLDIHADRWITILSDAVGYCLATGDIENSKRCLNYLYTAAFLEFCKEKFLDMGLNSPAAIEASQAHLGVEDSAAETFYTEKVDRAVKTLAMKFYENRLTILDRMNLVRGKSS